MMRKRPLSVGSLAVGLTVVTMASAAVAGVIQVRDQAVTAGPGPEVAANVQSLDPANTPQGDISSLRGTSAQGIEAWAFTTKSGKPAFAASIPDPSLGRDISVTGGCENVPGPISRCLTAFRGDELVIVGRAVPAVAEVRVTASDGQTYGISVNDGVWAAVLPAQGGSPPASIVGSTVSNEPIGSVDGERILRGLRAEAAAAASDLSPSAPPEPAAP